MSDDRSQLAMAARLFGRLLVHELDAATLEELAQPAIRSALAEVGVPLPRADDLDELAHEWLASLLHPSCDLSPPVHSLFRDGNHSGDTTAAVTRIATAAGLELAPSARNAPVDHIGCVLLLWADLVDDHPTLADRLAGDHMQWAEHALQPLSSSHGTMSGFYPAVARATIDLLRQIRADLGAPTRPEGTKPK